MLRYPLKVILIFYKHLPKTVQLYGTSKTSVKLFLRTIHKMYTQRRSEGTLRLEARNILASPVNKNYRG